VDGIGRRIRARATMVVVSREVVYYVVLQKHYYVSDQLSSIANNGTARESEGTPKLFAALW